MTAAITNPMSTISVKRGHDRRTTLTARDSSMLRFQGADLAIYGVIGLGWKPS
jgi:hypothetical protein